MRFPTRRSFRLRCRFGRRLHRWSFTTGWLESSNIDQTMNELTHNATTARIESEAPARVSCWRQLACSGSVFLWLAILLILLFQPDVLAAFVLVPPWCWVVAGVALAAIGYQHSARRWSLLAIGVWGVFAFVFVDETQGLWRTIGRAIYPPMNSEQPDETVRVISLNCAGDVKAAKELLGHEPDIVLLQESPSRQHVAELTESLFGSTGNFLHKGDTSVIANGTFSDLTPEADLHFAHARVQLAGDREIDLISLRLSPPVFRMDFWSSGFWTDHRDRRAQHRQQITQLVRQLRRESTQHLVILGGDFNTTPIDLALTDLRSRVFDTFRAVGRGLGNTGTNRSPLFRVDQIWASREIKAVSSIARPVRSF